MGWMRASRAAAAKRQTKCVRPAQPVPWVVWRWRLAKRAVQLPGSAAPVGRRAQAEGAAQRGSMSPEMSQGPAVPEAAARAQVTSVTWVTWVTWAKAVPEAAAVHPAGGQ